MTAIDVKTGKRKQLEAQIARVTLLFIPVGIGRGVRVMGGGELTREGEGWKQNVKNERVRREKTHIPIPYLPRTPWQREHFPS